MQKPKLTIVIPARNEEGNLERTIEDILQHIDTSTTEIIIVNDHSTDRTPEIIKNFERKYGFIKYLENTNSPGFGNTLKAGFAKAKGDFTVVMMADSSDEASILPIMLEKGMEGYDLISGSRYCDGGKLIGGPKVQKFFSRFVSLSLHKFIKIPTKDSSNAFKMYRTKILKSLIIRENNFAISLELTLKFFFKNARITEVPTTWKGREKGVSKFKILKQAYPYAKWYFWGLFKKWF